MKFKSYIKQKWLLSIIAVTLMIVYYLNFIQLPPAVSVELQQNYKEIILEGKNHLALMPENITKYEQNITRGHYFRGVE